MAQELLKIADGYLGVNQYDARHRALVADYNRVSPLPVGYPLKVEDDWCAAFVTVVGDKLGIAGLIPRECGVQRQILLCQDMGIWIGRELPQPGDLIFWDWNQNAWSDHVGFVESVSADGYVTTIEGNSNRRVEKNIFHYLATSISGYARPRYLAESADGNAVRLVVPASVVDAVMRGEYGNGSERVRRLRDAGYDPDAVQEEVNKRVTLSKSNDKQTPIHTSTVTEIAREVIAGKWDNGGQRLKLLMAAGHDPAEVQREVNRLMLEAEPIRASVTEIAREVVAGKWGMGADRVERLKSAGHDAVAVQKEVNRLMGVESASADRALEVVSLPVGKKYQGLHYQSRSISGDLVGFIHEEAKLYDIEPMFLITMLDYEGLWGSSRVAKTDNNWAGITWSETYKGHPDVVKFKGSARPSNEGGNYIHYQSVKDFLRDWIYLLRPNHTYKVSGKKTLTEFVKGLFRVGGAKFDYAAIGYPDYLNGMVARYKGIMSVNADIVGRAA
ncbi:CHAP domain-containing protein [Aerococcaceae bacterium DSM 111022]|nr:CHAP domain-containing protein [Aerococcaceae bacterium DSM 111022]